MTVIQQLRHEYRPYDTLREFDEGFNAYQAGIYTNPYGDGYKAQAWDRGLECGSRLERAIALELSAAEDMAGWDSVNG